LKNVILGVFSKREDADAALSRLREEGIKSEQISLAAQDEVLKEYQSKKPEGEGLLTGGLVEGLTGYLTTATAVVVPGLGAISVVGYLLSLVGFAVGALGAGLMGALVSIGVPRNVAGIYEKVIIGGGLLLAVTVDETTEDKVREILKAHNAQEITLIPFNLGDKRQQEEAGAAAGEGMFGAAFHEVTKPLKGVAKGGKR